MIKNYYDLRKKSITDSSIKDSKKFQDAKMALNGYKMFKKASIYSQATYEPNKKLSIKDIDDEDLIRVNIDDPEFRKEYNVTEAQYKKYKQ